MGSDGRIPVKTVVIEDIELQTQGWRRSIFMKKFYVQFSVGDTLRSTSRKMAAKSTSWTEQLSFDVDDCPELHINVYHRSLFGTGIFGSQIITAGVFRKLIDGGTNVDDGSCILDSYSIKVPEYNLWNDPSGITLKFALATWPDIKHRAVTAFAGATEVLTCNVAIPLIPHKFLNDLPSAYSLSTQYRLKNGCLLGTRQSLLGEICDAFNSPAEDAPRVYLLTGLAGSGKSAVAHSIAGIYEEKKRLGSLFCFDSSNVAGRNPQNLFSTIARDLANHDLHFKIALWEVVKNNRTLCESQLPMEQVEKLIVQPSGYIHTISPWIIIVDALDESGDPASRKQLLCAISEQISGNISPINLRFLITTRPEDDIITKLKACPHVFHKDMGKIPSCQVDEDIKKFISHSLKDCTDLLCRGDWCQELVRHSQHLFQWASTACNFIKGDDAEGSNQVKRMDELLEAASTAGTDSLDALYRTILTRLFGSKTTREEFRNVMAIVLALNEPLSMTSLSAFLGNNPDVQPVVERMASLLDGVFDKEKPIVPLHTSFRDFLLDETRGADFHVPIQREHSLHLGQASLKCIRNMLESTISDRTESGVKQAIPPHIVYSCRYWVNHLQLAGPLLDMLNKITLHLNASDDTASLQQPSYDSACNSGTMPAAIADMINYAFSYIVRSGDLTMAVEFLEQARGILWNQLACFDISMTELESRGGKRCELAKKFVQLSMGLKRAGSGGGEAPNSEEWRSVVNQIRQMDGFSRFLLPLQFSRLQQAAEGGPVIILNASKRAGDALIVLFDQPPVHVRLPSCSSDELAGQLGLCTRFSSLIQCNGGNAQEVGRFLRDLWVIVVKPIVGVLQNEIKLPPGSRIWWCPTSKFTALPLHAAGPYKKGQADLMDLYPSSYAPSLSALIRARKRTQPLKTTYPDATRHEVTFAAIGQSEPVGASKLPGVEKEIFNVQNETKMPENVMFKAVTGDAATVEGTIQAFHDHRWVHLSCHGKQDPKKPFDSGFAMRDGRLTLMRIIQEQYTHSEFAFLSACHSAVGNESTPDEVLHLAAGMQFAGFNGVIGTLCRVDDAAAHEVVTRFYKEMFKQPVISSEHAVRALHIALTEAERVSFFQRRVVFMHIGI